MNAHDIKDNNYIQMQITPTENKFYIRHCTKLFINLLFHLILKLTFEVTINSELLSSLIEIAQPESDRVKSEYRSSDATHKGSFDYTIR